MIDFYSDGILFCSAALALGAFKRGIANCVGVMVAKGWGIVRERYVVV
jgi:hypothetical protein